MENSTKKYNVVYGRRGSKEFPLTARRGYDLKTACQVMQELASGHPNHSFAVVKAVSIMSTSQKEIVAKSDS
mgnify:CR=1 FL=1|tara:strand:+ start:987 stop:1202 length:216 start_codon:yes stop_codon:yes gene_type:complete